MQVPDAPLPEHFRPAPHAAPVEPHLQAPPLQRFALAPSLLLGQVAPEPHSQVKGCGALPELHASVVPMHIAHTAPLVPQVVAVAETHVLPGPEPLQHAPAALHELVSH